MVNNEIKLTINISNVDPVNLLDLTIGLQSLAKLYSDFTNDDAEAKLFVKEVRKSSIEIDLITFSCLSVLPLMSNINNVVQFCEYISMLIKICKKQKLTETKDYLPTPTQKDFENFEKVIGITAANVDNNFTFTAKDIKTNTIYNNCIFYGNDAIEMKKNIRDLIKKILF